MMWFVLVFCIVVFFYFLITKKKRENESIEFPASWRQILDRKVLFYHNLSPEDKKRFEKDISRFLKKVRITGADTAVDIDDKLLVASSAVIPVFGFPDWDYTFLDEVLLYPGSFDSNYTINSREETITGMVGS